MIIKQNYFCSFKILGGGILRVPYSEIRKIVIDREELRSKVYLKDDPSPTIISSTPEEILEQTNQIDNR